MGKKKRKKKPSTKIPSTLDILKTIRNEVETPKGGFHTDDTKYDRKEKHRKDLIEEE